MPHLSTDTLLIVISYMRDLSSMYDVCVSARRECIRLGISAAKDVMKRYSGRMRDITGTVYRTLYTCMREAIRNKDVSLIQVISTSGARVPVPWDLLVYDIVMIKAPISVLGSRISQEGESIYRFLKREPMSPEAYPSLSFFDSNEQIYKFSYKLHDLRNLTCSKNKSVYPNLAGFLQYSESDVTRACIWIGHPTANVSHIPVYVSQYLYMTKDFTIPDDLKERLVSRYRDFYLRHNDREYKMNQSYLYLHLHMDPRLYPLAPIILDRKNAEILGRPDILSILK